MERTLRQDIYRAGDGVHAAWLKQRARYSPWWQRWWLNHSPFHKNLLQLEQQTLSPLNTGWIIANSQLVANEIQYYSSFPKERIIHIRNGIENSRFNSISENQKNEFRQQWSIHPDDQILLFVGSGWERKGLKFLIDHFCLHPQSKKKLLVVGKGKKPKNCPESIIFTGPLKQVEIAYAVAHLFVFLPIYEPSANVVIEALASHLPVITCKQNGAHEWVTPDLNGSVLEYPEDQQALKVAIDYWLNPIQKTTPPSGLSLQRNVEETLQLIERHLQSKK
jgi:UDP-glucose:(heptosyl)LPS alpha-1,3-glucosyltransferase